MEHRTLFSSDEIRAQVAGLASAIDNINVDSFVAITVLKGAAIFSSDLVRSMRTSTELEYVTAKSYVNDFTPGETLTISPMSLTTLEGRHVLIVEDIVDTGRTIRGLDQAVAVEQPASITTVALINKTGRRETDYEPDYSGFTITNELVYGYGLDWNQQHRSLPYIAVRGLGGP